MAEVKRKFLPLAKIKANQQNPRVISESKLKKLINSLLVFPKMMSLRPITLDDNNCVLGGNMRQTALGDEFVTFHYGGTKHTIPFSDIVEQARIYINDECGSFEKLAEWGLIRK